MSEDREEGYYWIARYGADEPILALWDSAYKEWYVPGDDVPTDDGEVEYVSEKLDIPLRELSKNPGYRVPEPVPDPFALPFLPEPGMVYQFNDALSENEHWESGGWRPCIRNGTKVIISGMKLWERTKEENEKAAVLAFDAAAKQVQRGVRHAFESFLDEATKAGATPHLFVQIGFDKK